MPDASSRLPIKIIEPLSHDFDSDPPGGSRRSPFVEVTNGLRKQLSAQVTLVRSHFASEFAKEPKVPAVARIKLRREAIAKSHRPISFFNDDLCPVIGVESFGELLVSVNQVTLATLSDQLLHAKSETAQLHLSTIESISPYVAIERTSQSTQNLDETLATEGSSLKVRLFRHWLPQDDQNIVEAFLRRIASLNGPIARQRSYGTNISVFEVSNIGLDAALSLSQFPGIASIGTFPEFGILAPSLRQAAISSATDFPGPTPGVDYPIIGLIDGGVAPDHQILAPWVDEVYRRQPSEYCNYDHGTFIAGLLAHGRRLNHGDESFPPWQARVFDVIALPRSGERITEADLLDVVQAALSRRRDIKVWNISINYQGRPCDNDRFSDLALALDRIQDEYDVQFVISAGNCSADDLREFVGHDLGRNDFISPPAESVRSLTVGAIAHKDHATSLARAGEPAPFSRRGPGPAFIPKPEVSHIGGNCSKLGDCSQIGVLSFDTDAHIQEWIGTSFSTPLVALMLGHVFQRVDSPTSRNLAKALVIHSAVLKQQGVDTALLPYRGFGVPGDVDEVLSCSPNEITLVFEPQLERGPFFQKRNFPMPPSLFRNGRFVGEVFMTLVYDPPLHPQGGIEYCQSNVEVSLGVYRKNGKGETAFHGMVPQVLDRERYATESHLIEHCFKYSPVKVFHRSCARGQGISGDEWRLKMLVRHRQEIREITQQNLALLVTIRDPSATLPVYDEVVKMMQKGGWAISDLRVRERVRTRV